MKTFNVAMEVQINDDGEDDLKRITHHIENFVDLASWPEIVNISNVTVDEVSNEPYYNNGPE